MLVNGKMHQKIPVFFSCLLKAFQLSNSMPPKSLKAKKTSLNIVTESQSSSFKARNTVSDAQNTEKMELFKRLQRLFNLNKITKNIVKLMMANSTPSQLKREISTVFFIFIWGFGNWKISFWRRRLILRRLRFWLRNWPMKISTRIFCCSLLAGLLIMRFLCWIKLRRSIRKSCLLSPRILSTAILSIICLKIYNCGSTQL